MGLGLARRLFEQNKSDPTGPSTDPFVFIEGDVGMVVRGLAGHIEVVASNASY